MDDIELLGVWGRTFGSCVVQTKVVEINTVWN
jgi:hypothetical protein